MTQTDLLALVAKRNPNEPEFIQAVDEVLLSIMPVIDRHAEFRNLKLFERMTEPERLISFRVTWLDDKINFFLPLK